MDFARVFPPLERVFDLARFNFIGELIQLFDNGHLPVPRRRGS